MATKLGMKLADYTVTEAGFGADLGAEKFLDIKCRFGDLKPSAAVIVATIRALKHHGGATKENYDKEDLVALEKGFANLEKHIENIKKFGLPAIVSINRFPSDTENEIKFIEDRLAKMGVECSLTEVFAKGGDGALDLAEKVIKVCDEGKANFKPLYDVNLSIKEKLEIIAKEVYGADGVEFTVPAMKNVKNLEKLGLDKMPICVAKTQYSLSDNPDLLARPEGFHIVVREVKVSNGAGFLIALTGSIMTMPGLPKVPAADNIDILPSGEIVGLF